MSYASKQAMIDRFGDVELQQLTDRDGTVSAINDTVLNVKLAEADAEIDAYLVGRYTLPLSSVPAVLIGKACDITWYRLQGTHYTEMARQNYEDAVKFLTKVAEGKISLGLDQTNTVTPEAAGVAGTANERVFSREKLNDYHG